MPRHASRALPAALLLVTACPGGSGDDTEASTATLQSSSDDTTADLPTTDGPPGPTTAADTTSGDTSDDTSGGTTEAEPDCSDSRLVSRWVLPAATSCFGVAMDDSGAVTVLGGSGSSRDYGAELYRLVDGELAWSLVHPPPDDFVRPHALAVRGDGVAVIVGFTSDPGSFELLPWTAAYDASGALLWEHVDSTNACADPPCRKGQNQGVVVTADGEFLVAGERGLYADFAFQMTGVLRRYDAAMGEVAVSEFPTPLNDGDDETKAIALRADGGVVLVGETHKNFASDLWIARLAADGALESIDTLSAGEDDVVEHVAALSDGSIVLSAKADDFYLARVDADLTPIWHGLTGWYGPVLAGPDDAVFAAVDDQRVVDKFDAAGKRQWSDDPCLEGNDAGALGLSPDGAQLLVCRYDQDGTLVEVYDAL